MAGVELCGGKIWWHGQVLLPILSCCGLNVRSVSQWPTVWLLFAYFDFWLEAVEVWCLATYNLGWCSACIILGSYHGPLIHLDHFGRLVHKNFKWTEFWSLLSYCDWQNVVKLSWNSSVLPISAGRKPCAHLLPNWLSLGHGWSGSCIEAK